MTLEFKRVSVVKRLRNERKLHMITVNIRQLRHLATLGINKSDMCADSYNSQYRLNQKLYF